MGELDSVTLGELERLGAVRLFRGKVISKRDIEARPGPYPVYSSSIRNNGLFGHYGRYMFDEHLITWSVDGGGDFFYRPKHKFSVTNVCGYMRVDSEDVDAQYLAYYLQKLHSTMRFDYTLKAHPSVIREAYQVSLPGIAEQRRVAASLAEADDLIASLERLIAKKQAIKQGMMQQLMTGRTRLPGFREHWSTVLWLDVTSRRPGNGQIKGRLASARSHRAQFPGFSASGQDVWLPTFDFEGTGIVISAVGSRCGRAYFANGRWSAIANTNVILPTPKLLDPGFALLYFDNEDFWVKGGSGQPYVQMNPSLKQQVDLPPLNEQIAIREVLQDADHEITTLETRLCKARDIKTGMMQQLLTGRIRLPVGDAA